MCDSLLLNVYVVNENILMVKVDRYGFGSEITVYQNCGFKQMKDKMMCSWIHIPSYVFVEGRGISTCIVM